MPSGRQTVLWFIKICYKFDDTEPECDENWKIIVTNRNLNDEGKSFSSLDFSILLIVCHRFSAFLRPLSDEHDNARQFSQTKRIMTMIKAIRILVFWRGKKRVVEDNKLLVHLEEERRTDLNDFTISLATSDKWHESMLAVANLHYLNCSND